MITQGKIQEKNYGFHVMNYQQFVDGKNHDSCVLFCKGVFGNMQGETMENRQCYCCVKRCLSNLLLQLWKTRGTSDAHGVLL